MPVQLPRDLTRKIFFVLFLLFGITALHYSTSTLYFSYHEIYRRCYYIPIILASFWFGLYGGLGTSLLISLIYFPHVLRDWGGHLLTENLSRTMEIVLYNAVGLITGYLAQHLAAERTRYRTTAYELQETNKELRQKTEALEQAYHSLSQKSAELEKTYQDLRTRTQEVFAIEKQLQRVDRLAALGNLSATLAHEIRNPLASIKGTAEILKDKFDPAAQEYEFVQILIAETERLNLALTNFLTFARTQNPDQAVSNVATVLHHVIALLKPQLTQSAVQVDIAEEGELFHARINSEQLKQVFLNLILNAIQAMTSSGQITIQLTELPETIRVSIADTGPGIPVAEAEKIFTPFFSTRANGAGLGLSIASKIVNTYNGSLSLDQSYTNGARFLISLPRAPKPL